MKYHYLSPEEINNLKQDLISNRRSGDQFSNITYLFNLYKKYRHSEIEPIFENNIRQNLIVNYQWENNICHFFYRVITINKKNYIIKKGYSKKIFIKKRRYKFTFFPNNSISIYSGYIKKRLIYNTSEKKKDRIIDLSRNKIIISGIKECKIDGFFKLNNSNFIEMQNDDNLICLFNNSSNDFINKAKYVCTEVKLSKGSMSSLLRQFYRDKTFLEEYAGYKNILYLGFVGSVKNYNIDFRKLKIPENINLIIYEIHDCFWGGRSLTNYIDWETIKEIKEIRNRLEMLKKYIQKINNNYYYIYEKKIPFK